MMNSCKTCRKDINIKKNIYIKTEYWNGLELLLDIKFCSVRCLTEYYDDNNNDNNDYDDYTNYPNISPPLPPPTGGN